MLSDVRVGFRLSAIGVGSVNDADDRHAMVAVVDAVDHMIGAAAGAVSIVKRRPEPLADPLWVVQQWPNDELVRRERDSLGQLLGKLPPGRG